MAREYTEDTRAEIEAELDRMADELEAHVTDRSVDYGGEGPLSDDRAPNIPDVMRKCRALEKRLQAFDKYGVNSMSELQADPVFSRDNLLFRAMHSYANAPKRWQERRTTGLTDHELLDAFNTEAGSGYSGYSGDEGWYDCRPGRFSWKNREFKDQVITGSTLVRLLREVMQIPEPVGRDNAAVEQLTMF